eukprot:m.13112 g.13112  ORF g.13112 m.13112 type:complete len:140 (+) comp24482_c0_seq1:1545-1964(+)
MIRQSNRRLVLKRLTSGNQRESGGTRRLNQAVTVGTRGGEETGAIPLEETVEGKRSTRSRRKRREETILEIRLLLRRSTGVQQEMVQTRRQSHRKERYKLVAKLKPLSDDTPTQPESTSEDEEELERRRAQLLKQLSVD